jgi:hypothetical protein
MRTFHFAIKTPYSTHFMLQMKGIRRTIMVRKLFYVISFGLLLTLASSVPAWAISPPEFIGPGEEFSTGYEDVWGPEFGQDCEIQGGTWSGPAFIGLNAYNDNLADLSEVNLGRNGTGGLIDIGEYLLGESWWAHDGGYVAHNQWSGTCNVRGWLWMGGKMNLYGGTTKITGGFNMDPYKNWAGYTQLTIYMPDPDPLSGGRLNLPRSLYDSFEIGRWVHEGYLVAGGDAVGRHIVYDFSEEGRVILTAVPEPATMTLLCLGALALIRRKRS